MESVGRIGARWLAQASGGSAVLVAMKRESVERSIKRFEGVALERRSTRPEGFAYALRFKRLQRVPNAEQLEHLNNRVLAAFDLFRRTKSEHAADNVTRVIDGIALELGATR